MGYIEDLREIVGHRRLILAGASCVIRNDRGELLLQQRVYPAGRWCFPGGLTELGESVEDTARREVREETGLAVGRLALIGVYSGPDHLCRAANGDEWYVVNSAFAALDWQGAPRVSDGESVRLQWFSPDAMPETLVRSHREILRDYLRLYQAGTLER